MSSPPPQSSSSHQNLNNFNGDIMKCLAELRDRREEVHLAILAEEEERAKIQKEMSALEDRVRRLNESITRKTIARAEYDKTIEESNQAYKMIVDSSNTLLQVLRKEKDSLTKRKIHS